MANILVTLQIIALTVMAAVCLFKPEWLTERKRGPDNMTVKTIGFIAVFGILITVVKILRYHNIL
jgi:amino acid permease